MIKAGPAGKIAIADRAVFAERPGDNARGSWAAKLRGTSPGNVNVCSDVDFIFLMRSFLSERC